MHRLMKPLGALIIFCVIITTFLLYQLHRHGLHDAFFRSISEINHSMEMLLREQSSALSLAIKPIAADPAVQKALREGDSKALLMQWGPTFAKMKEENRLTHFYFMDKNRVCLLRVHKPLKKGDIINRFTALEAEWSRKTSSGIELGTMGTLTLRVVQPVIIDNELLGYIEMGKEIEDVIDQLHFQSDIHMGVLLRKSYLERSAWEDGMRSLSRDANWDLLKDSVLVYSSLGKIPITLLEKANTQTGLRHKHEKIDDDIYSNGESYRLSFIAIKDVSGKEIGDLLVINNTTDENVEFFDTVVMGGLIGFTLIGLVIGFIYLLLRRTDDGIQNQQRDLFESQQRLEQLARHSRTYTWEVDEHGKYIYLSDVVYNVLGYKSDELIGKYFYDLHHENGKELFKEMAMEKFERKETFTNVKNHSISKERRSVWLTTNALPVVAQDGRLIGYRGNDTDITERKIAEEKVNRLAFYDSLTHLPNRTLLIDRLNQAMVLSSRNNQFNALLFIDLDNFKTLNDTLGHVIGDNLLKQSSQRLIGCVREGDSIARLGGDEFVVLLSDLGSDEKYAATTCELIGENILAALSEPYELEGIPYQSSASIGITLFNGDSTSDDELMKQADLAMYKSKDAGRNTLSFFDPNMELSLRARALMEEEIRRGIDEEQFLLYYQPQVDKDCRVYGVEALVRWNHPERGMVPPIEFIPLAEETGLIVPLGAWIIKTACKQIALWSKSENFLHISVAVNVSARQFNQKDFSDEVLTILEQSGADPKRLKLELTESILVQNIQEVIEKMERLKSHGVRFSLDDFGTGYSSLSYLKRLPLDQLKIDQSFVRDILTDPNDAIICKSTIALTESMGLSVIAEGVETKEQMDTLLSFGCHAYQGYYFSRPLSVEAFEAFQNDLLSANS